MKLTPSRLQTAKKLGVNLNLDADSLKKEHVDAIYGNGMNAHVFTVNNLERARELFDWGVDAVITDTLFGGIASAR